MSDQDAPSPPPIATLGSDGEWVTLDGASISEKKTLPTSGMTDGAQMYSLTGVLDRKKLISSTPLSPDEEHFATPDTMPEAPNATSNLKRKPAGLGNQVKALLP